MCRRLRHTALGYRYFDAVFIFTKLVELLRPINKQKPIHTKKSLQLYFVEYSYHFGVILLTDCPLITQHCVVYISVTLWPMCLHAFVLQYMLIRKID